MLSLQLGSHARICTFGGVLDSTPVITKAAFSKTNVGRLLLQPQPLQTCKRVRHSLSAFYANSRARGARGLCIRKPTTADRLVWKRDAFLNSGGHIIFVPSAGEAAKTPP